MTIDAQLLDSRTQLAQIDPNNVLGSIEALSDQVRQAWRDSQVCELNLPQIPQQIVVAGMGGSGLGASVVKHLFQSELKVPFQIVNDYELPGYVNKQTLVILSSYSGNTEETIACAQQALDKKAMTVVITAGGKLLQLANEHHWSVYQINSLYNPSNQPRMAIGYAIIGLIGILVRLNILSVSAKEIDQLASQILVWNDIYSVESKQDQNQAKTLAFALVDRRPNLVAAEFLTGACHVASNQFNENAKTFASYYQIPEINHHLLESLELPKSNHLDNIFLFFSSKLYLHRNQLRIDLTQEAVQRQGCEALAIPLTAPTRLEQVFELISLCAYTNYYLAMLHGIDPCQIKIVDWFKQQLEQAQ